ncbi:Retinol dehydrogenase 12 [Cucumispora dikerogammari]|nr:Retinol dehydrogenase 12 [Cucumispora dikerogammari]
MLGKFRVSDRKYKETIKFITKSWLPYIIKVFLLFSMELLFNFIRKPKLSAYSEIRNKKILVTGGTGGIGSELINELKKHNKLFIISRSYVADSSFIKYLIVDLEKLDINNVLFQLKGVKIDILICAAGVLDTSDLYRNYSINYYAHKTLALALGVPKVLIVSSCVALTVNVKLEDLRVARKRDIWYGKSYAESKYLLFSLAEQLVIKGVDAVLVHPGIINTGLFGNQTNIVEKILKLFIKSCGISRKRGASNILNSLSYLSQQRVKNITFFYLDLNIRMKYRDSKWEVE